MARSQLQEHIVFRWLSLKSTIEYLGEWEMLYNPNFNCTAYPSTCPYDYFLWSLVNKEKKPILLWSFY